MRQSRIGEWTRKMRQHHKDRQIETLDDVLLLLGESTLYGIAKFATLDRQPELDSGDAPGAFSRMHEDYCTDEALFEVAAFTGFHLDLWHFGHARYDKYRPLTIAFMINYWCSVFHRIAFTGVLSEEQIGGVFDNRMELYAGILRRSDNDWGTKCIDFLIELLKRTKEGSNTPPRKFDTSKLPLMMMGVLDWFYLKTSTASFYSSMIPAMVGNFERVYDTHTELFQVDS